MTAVLAPVSELAEQVRGVSYGKEDARDVPEEGYLPVLRAGNIADSGIVFTDFVYVPERLVSKKQVLRAGDVLIATSSGSLDVVGKAAPVLADFEGAFGAFCKVLRPNRQRVDVSYFSHFFRTPEYRRIVSGLAAGANINNLRNEHLDKLLIPLPPITEQRRIAAILDKTDALRNKRREALTQIARLSQSIFVDMFGDPVDNNKCWPTSTLGSLVRKIGSGATPIGGDAAYKASGISLIRSMNVHDGQFMRRNLAFIDEQQARKLQNVVVEAGDVLLNITGASVARVCRAPADVLPARVNQHVMIIRPSDALNPLFLERMLLTTSMKRHLLKVGGVGATREAITKSEAEGLTVIVPPEATQMEFVRRMREVEALLATSEASLNESEGLFASLQHLAFAGAL